MSQSGIRMPSGKMVRPRVVQPMLKLVKKYDEALALADKIEKKASEVLRDSDRPPPKGEDDKE